MRIQTCDNFFEDVEYISIPTSYISVLSSAIESTDLGDSSRYSVCLLTLNRLGDRAVTSQHIEPEQATPSPGHSAQSGSHVRWDRPAARTDGFSCSRIEYLRLCFIG